MTALMRGHDVTGLPVVDLSTGEDIAEIRDLIFEPGAGVVAGFTLAQRGFLGRRMRDVLPVEAIHSIGTHAVTVDSADAITAPGDAPAHVGSADRKADVTSDDVLTESGRNLGRVQDVILTGGPNPRVVGYEIGGGSAGAGFVPIDTSRTVSRSTLIVPDDFENRVRTDLTGLAGEVDNLGEEHVIRLSDLIGQPTVSLSDAENSGKVRGIVTDGDRIVAVHNGEGLVDAAAIRSFEGDAVTYDGAVRDVADGADSPLGRRVLDVNGDELGRLADFEIDATGHVDIVTLDDGRTVPGRALRVIGSYAVIVAANPDTTPLN